MADQSLMDKSLRSVFVGNIPYEATEERLKDIFSEVGPVLSFKLVYDRETGKQKGYGFCEYKDQETALSAMRNLNGYEIGGRTLRVDNACTEKSRMEMQSLLQGPVVENPYGEAVEADKAPEAISKVVASLPPEQLFELMRQMKQCVQNNPNEARTMLLQNPQLTYALLQAQVVMRIVDAETAARMLHKTNPTPTPIMPSDKPAPAPVPVPAPIQAPVSQPSVVPPPVTTARDEGWMPPAGVAVNSRPTPVTLSAAQPGIPALHSTGDMDLRPLDPRLARIADQDLRVAGPPTAVPPIVPQPTPRDANENFPGDHFPRDPRMGLERFPLRDHPERVDPRTGVAPMPVSAPRPMQSNGPPNIAARPSLPISKGVNMGASDQEKAALIMQVLQLSDEQIAGLPPEQRQSILVLKEQIAKTTQM